jgi:putative DNA primase/helicase
LILEFEKIFDEADKDTELIGKLTMPEELSGLLNLALIALRKLREDNGFNDIPVEKIRKQYEEKSNVVKAFIQSCCVVNLEEPGHYTLTTDVYNEYLKFCQDKHERPLEVNVFGKKLAELGIEKERIRYYGGQRENCYIGIKLLSELRGKNESLQ